MKFNYDNPELEKLHDSIVHTNLPRFDYLLYTILTSLEKAVTDWDMTHYLFGKYECVTEKHLSRSICPEASNFSFLNKIVRTGLNNLVFHGLAEKNTDSNNRVWYILKRKKDE